MNCFWYLKSWAINWPGLSLGGSCCYREACKCWWRRSLISCFYIIYGRLDLKRINAKKHSPNPYTVHNTPKPISTLALNSSQTCEIFFTQGLWSRLIWVGAGCKRRRLHVLDLLGAGGVGTPAWVLRKGWRKEGRQSNIEMCVCMFYPVYWRGGEGDGGRTEWEEEAVQYMRVFLWGTSRLVLPRRRPGEHTRKGEREKEECECNGEQIQKHWGSKRMESIDQETQLGERVAGLGRQPMPLLTDVMFWPHGSLSASSCFNDAPLCQWAIIRRSQITTLVY